MTLFTQQLQVLWLNQQQVFCEAVQVFQLEESTDLPLVVDLNFFQLEHLLTVVALAMINRPLAGTNLHSKLPTLNQGQLAWVFGPYTSERRLKPSDELGFCSTIAVGHLNSN